MIGAVAFVAGVAALQLQAVLPTVAALLAFALLSALLVAWALTRAERGRATFLLVTALAGLAFGFAYAGGRAHLRLADELQAGDQGRDVVVTGVVASLPVRLERGVRFEFEVESIEGEVHVPSRVLLGWYAMTETLKAGQRWRLSVRLKRPHGAMNPAGFDFEGWMVERNLRATGYVRSGRNDEAPRLLDPMVWRPLLAIERLRGWLRDRLESRLGTERHGGVLIALAIGDQRAINEADWGLFNRTGISHLVSISGLHITMLAALAAGLVAAVWRRTPRLLARLPAQTAAVLAGAVVALLYALLAGWGVPAQRTVLMLACVALAWLARGQMPPGRALAIAAAVVCLFDPWSVIAAGFWLSFGAVAAIVWVMQGRFPTATARWREVLRGAVRVQLAVTLALIPATVLLFQQVSLVSPLANAIAIPLVSWVTTPLALLGAVLAALPTPMDAVAGPVLQLAHLSFAAVAWMLGAMATLPAAAVAVSAPPWGWAVLAVAGVVWLLAPPGWPLRYLGAVALVPLFVWPVDRPRAGELWVTALDVGQGSAIVIESRDQTWLYDAGPRYSADSDAGLRVVLPYLRWRGIDSLDGMVISHLDSDHSGGAASVMRGVAVRRVLSSIPSGHAALNGATSEQCFAGQRIEADGLELRVLHPAADDYQLARSTNAMSCVIEARMGATRFLLTGDIPAAEELALLGREIQLPVVLLAAPHHGSRSSSSEALLAATRPRWVVVQAGYRNRFGHPHPAVIERYRQQGIRLERTDHSGALQWRFGAQDEVQLTRWRSAAVRYWHNRPEVSAAVTTTGPPEVIPDEGDWIRSFEPPVEPFSGS